MFNIVDDPECMNNLANLEEYALQKSALKQQLFESLRAQQDPRMLGNGHLFDEYVYADERHRGFYERFMAGEEIRAGWVNPSDFEEGPLEEE
jgi:hypothetical protein